MTIKHILNTLCLSAILYGGTSVAQTVASNKIPADPKVKIGKLENGLTYYIRQNPKPEKKVELRLAVNAGSVLENPDQRGLAHFMEHMGFNGSKNFPKNELVGYLQSIGVKFGADLNAYTSFDETVYILPISSDKPEILEKGFTVLEDWAFNNLLDSAEIEKERGVVLEESRLSKGSSERFLRQYLPKLFNGSLYAERLPIGTDSVLRNFKHSTLTDFYKQWYRPNLMAVIVVGDIEPAEAERLIKKHFSNAKNPTDLRDRPASISIRPRTTPDAMVLTDEEATQTTLQIFNFVRPKKPVATWADYRRTTVEGLMTSLINNRLTELTQSEKPPFLYAQTGLSSFLRGYETFTSYASLGDKPVNEAVNALVAETERARKFGFLEAELARAKANLLNQVENQYKERDKVESGNLVWSYVSNFLQQAPIPSVDDRLAFIKKTLPGITLAEINAMAREMPTSANAFSLITAPAKVKDKLPDSNGLLTTLVAASKKPVTPYTEKTIASKLLDKEPVKGSTVKQSGSAKLGTTDLTLSNGITVTLKPTTFKNNEILMDAWRRGGYRRFPLTELENAEHAARIVQNMGVKDFSPSDLKKFLTGKSVSVWPYANPNEEGIEGRTTLQDFETFLQLTHLYLTQPRKDPALFNSYVDKQKSSVQYIMQNPQAVFNDTVNQVLYNRNPWAGKMPTAEDYNKLNLDKTMSIYKQMFSNPYGMHFTFTGNLDLNTVKPLLEKYLASLPTKPFEPSSVDVGLRPVRGVVEKEVKKGKDAKSAIRIIFSGDAVYSHKEALVLNGLVDALNIEVIEKLREEMGGIYGGGFNGYITRHPHVGYQLSAYIPCGPENVEKLTNALMSLIKSARDKGIDQKTFDKVKETWIKQQQVKLQDNGFWHRTLSHSWIAKDNPEEVFDFENRLQTLTLEDIRQAANKYLDLNNYVKMVLNPEVVDKKAQVN